MVDLAQDAIVLLRLPTLAAIDLVQLLLYCERRSEPGQIHSQHSVRMTV